MLHPNNTEILKLWPVKINQSQPNGDVFIQQYHFVHEYKDMISDVEYQVRRNTYGGSDIRHPNQFEWLLFFCQINV